MIIESRAAGLFMKNGFVVSCEETREGVFIDPGDEVAELLSYIDREHIEIRQILLTHAHVDHVTGVAAAKRTLDVPIWLHRDDLFLYERAVESGALFGLRVEAPPSVDAFYEPGQTFSFGGYDITVHHTPGHCPGGVCLAVQRRQVGQGGQVGRGGQGGQGGDAPHLFVGDTLFSGSIGRFDLPGGDYDTLIRSIRTVLFPFGDDAVVHPGHGPATTIGRERRMNPFLAGGR